MEPLHDIVPMLELLLQPAFAVKDGKVLYTNRALQGFPIDIGTDIANLIHSGIDEYQDFSDGCLYLTLFIGEQVRNASVSRIGGVDLFLLEQDGASTELQVLALAAKELREPLANVMLTADRLFPQLTETPEHATQAAQLNRGLYQMLRLVGNMSDAARYNAATGDHNEVRDICAVLEEIFSSAAALTEAAGVTLTFSNLPGSIFCPVQEELLERAIYNIISNALKATPKGGTIKAQLSRHKNRLRLTIQDSGAGIPAHLRSGVYFRYLRGPSLEDSGNGIGLGMVLIRAAARVHGGTVLLECPENQGTRISMTFTIGQIPSVLRSPHLHIDYAGCRNHGLIELSQQLPAELFDPTIT